MAFSEAFQAHLASGATRVCRAWVLKRKDGVEFGFTDHDLDLVFDGITFRADTGLAARAIQQGTGLSVDNSEAVGILSDAAITEEDIQAGRFDGAEVLAWLVNWQNVEERHLQFRGHLGEIAREGASFTAELRGLTEGLNQPQGRVYQSVCSARLGDAACGFNTDAPGYFYEGPVEEVEGRKVFRFADLSDFDERWFERGRFKVISGAAKGLVGIVKNDRLSADGREIELWETLGLEVQPGDVIRVDAGCDGRAETCRLKFNNMLNFQGFPHIPGDDWLMNYPNSGQPMEGGSLRKPYDG